MSFTLVAICVLGSDLLLYALFCWIYPNRDAKSVRPTQTYRGSQHAPHA